MVIYSLASPRRTAPDGVTYNSVLKTVNETFTTKSLNLNNNEVTTASLEPATAEEVWEVCNKKLADPSMSVRNLIRQSNVETICTTDDPIDTLEWHKKIAEDETFEVKVLPAWRPDKAMNLEKPEYLDYLAKLAVLILPEHESDKTDEDFHFSLSNVYAKGKTKLGYSAIHMDMLAKEIERMIILAKENLSRCFDAVLNTDFASFEKAK